MIKEYSSESQCAMARTRGSTKLIRNFAVAGTAGIQFYLNNPQTTPEDELLTEVCMPIER